MTYKVEDKNNIPKLTKDMERIIARISKKVGDYIEGKILDTMTQQYPGWPALAPSTIAGKGSSKAWIDTGELASQITSRVLTQGMTSQVEVGIFDSDKGLVARWLEFGTDPYTILPKEKSMLAWRDKSGKWHWAKKVDHPGIPERPLFRLVFDVEQENVDRLIQKELEREISKLLI